MKKRYINIIKLMQRAAHKKANSKLRERDRAPRENKKEVRTNNGRKEEQKRKKKKERKKQESVRD